MNEIISEHDHLKNIFTQNTSNPNLHPLIKQIDEWEKESIEKIQQKAKELQEQLLQPITTQINELSKRLEPLSEQLKKCRELDDSWFTINQDDETPLVRNTSITLKAINEWFDQVSDDRVRIAEDGEVVIHDSPQGHKEIRGKNEYSSSCHKIRLRIEYTVNMKLFLDINSKATPLQSASYLSRTAYLWFSGNRIYSNGSYQSKTSNPSIEMNKNDIITLIFNCDNCKISMISERTNAKHELTVNVDNCPFPWQLHVNMYHAKECIRILPTIAYKFE